MGRECSTLPCLTTACGPRPPPLPPPHTHPSFFVVRRDALPQGQGRRKLVARNRSLAPMDRLCIPVVNRCQFVRVDSHKVSNKWLSPLLTFSLQGQILPRLLPPQQQQQQQHTHTNNNNNKKQVNFNRAPHPPMVSNVYAVKSTTATSGTAVRGKTSASGIIKWCQQTYFIYYTY